MTILYPWGYGLEEIDAETLWARLAKAHPEFRRRAYALIVAGRGVIGVGGFWRSSITQAKNYARDPRGFAPPGLSFHEWQDFASGVRGSNAIDFVGRDLDDNGVRESAEHLAAWKFLADNAAAYGLVEFSNVNNEPWHGQCADIPKSVRDWKAAGRPDPDASFVLPTGSPSTSTPTPTSTPKPTPAPVPPGKTIAVNVNLPELKKKTGPKVQVEMLQSLLNVKGKQGLDVDGDFGSKTETAVRNWQTFFEMNVDGIVGAKTWASLFEISPG